MRPKFLDGGDKDVDSDRCEAQSIEMSDCVVIDARGHLLGRLASVIAKQLLGGKKIVVVRCEEILISGSCKC